MDQPHARPQRPRTFESRRRKRHWFRDSRKALLARAEASREETGGASRKRACGFRLPASCAGVRRAAVRRGWRHVPDRGPAPRPHPRPAVDREAPAAATRVGAGEAEHGPPPGGRGGEPLLAQPAFPHGRAGARPRGGPPGGRLPGAQGGAGVQVPRVPAAGGPARPPQGHREVVLTRATPPASCGDEREPLAGAPRSPGQAERVPATEAPGPRSPPPAVCFGRIASRFSCPEDGTDGACVLRDAERNLRAAAIKLPTALWPLGLGARFCRGLCRACSLTFCRQVLPKRT